MNQDAGARWTKRRRLALFPGAGAGEAVRRELEHALGELSGVQQAAVDQDVLVLRYDLRLVDCAAIVAQTMACGVRLDESRRARLCRWLVGYREAAEREALAHEAGWDSYVTAIYASRYVQRHDDDRRGWREYASHRGPRG